MSDSSFTRNNGTVHACVKARLTRVAIRIRIRIRITDPDHHQNLIICSLAHCQRTLKISRKSVPNLLRKVANKQTHSQTNNDDNITSLAHVVRRWGAARVNRGSHSFTCHPQVEWAIAAFTPSH